MKIISTLLICSFAFTYGVYVGVYKAFPFDYVHSLKQLIKPTPLATERKRESNRLKQFESVSTKSDIVFVGDSITEFAIWDEWLPRYNIVNRGVSGDATFDILLRVDSILSVEPKVIFMMVGINDIHQNVPIENIFKNYSKLIDTFVESGAQVIVQSTIQCEVSKCGTTRVSKVNELNSLLKSSSVGKNVLYLDLKNLSNVNGLKESFTTDGIHLTVDAYAYWVSLMSSALKEL